jgi:hypothetical protein
MELVLKDRGGHTYPVDCAALVSIDGVPYAPAPSRPEANIEGRVALCERNLLLVLSVLNISSQGDCNAGHETT